MEIVFVVDDGDINLAVAKQALQERYRVLTLSCAAKMFSLIEKIIPDLILLDIEMPEMNGFAAMEKLMQNEHTAKIPVIFLTSHTQTDDEAHGFELGAVDFIAKPFSKPVLLNRVASHLHMSDLIKKRTQRIERLQNGIISVLADMVESRDQITGGHIERTTMYLKILIDEMLSYNLCADEIRAWDLDVVIPSARLHDVGKIAVSDLILNKPGKLTPEEFDAIKIHTTEGERIIDQIVAQTGDEIFLQHAKLFAGYHHERWDGDGYPRKLKSEEIPLQGRIMAVADVYDALVSERPYKKAYSDEQAIEIIMEQAGKQFDPKIAQVFFEVKDKFKAVNLCGQHNR